MPAPPVIAVPPTTAAVALGSTTSRGNTHRGKLAEKTPVKPAIAPERTKFST
jgi:hypothetical protein